MVPSQSTLSLTRIQQPTSYEEVEVGSRMQVVRRLVTMLCRIRFRLPEVWICRKFLNTVELKN